MQVRIRVSDGFAMRILFACCVSAVCAFSPVASAADSSPATAPQHHPLWSIQGKTNKVYLLGSVHFLSPSEQLPEAIDAAYRDAEALVMEIDMDDLDPAGAQQTALELGMLPADQTLEQQIGADGYARLIAQTRELGIDANVLSRFRPWFAAMTLVQLQLMKMGLDPNAGVEQRLTARAGSDGKPIQGLESLEQQLGMLAQLPAEQQREFLMYSIEDSQRMTQEIGDLLSAWRRGDSAALAALLAEGFDKYPDLYRPLTVERNRRWIGDIEALLDDRDDYLVVVGTLHLVGADSVIELLERNGHTVTQH